MTLTNVTEKVKLETKGSLPYLVLPEQVEDEAKIARIDFYKSTTGKLVFFWLSIILSGGIFALLAKWKRPFYVRLRYIKGTPRDADYLVVHCVDKTIDYVKVHHRAMYIDGVNKVYRIFTYRLYKFYFDAVANQFKPIQFTIRNKTFAQIHKEMGKGFQSEEAYQERLSNYGQNSFDLPAKSSLEIITDELLSPFYFFQLFAIIFWGFFDHYPAYAGFIFGLSLITLSISFYKIQLNDKKLRQKVAYEILVNVFRNPEEFVKNNKEVIVKMIPKNISSAFLVPGDLVEVPCDMKMPCDILLIDGTCVMDEGMLSGDSIPIIKQQLPFTDKMFDPANADQYTLFAGTDCLETRKSSPDVPVLGIVLRTGFSTAKAKLIRSFIYAKPEDFKFYRDSLKYVGAMSCLALVCFALSVVSFVHQGENVGYIIEKALDIITIAVPPALPTVVAVGTLLAGIRLEKQKIITKSETKINVAGKVKFMCFDKTGTLTHDSLDLHGVRTCIDFGRLRGPKFAPATVDNISKTFNTPTEKGLGHKMLELMTTCHSLTHVKGNITGDPLDLRMFEATGWIYRENSGSAGFDFRLATLNPPKEMTEPGYYHPKSDVVVLKRFEFSAKLQRMSVIVKDMTEGKQRVYVKGAPEMILSLAKPDTVPIDFQKILTSYTQSGLRVLACGTKVLEKDVPTNDDLAREPFEQGIEFIGFLVFENKLKESTSTVIKKLKDAEINTIMLTGDNPLTAIFVSRDSGIVEQSQRVILGTLVQPEEDYKEKYIEWKYIDPVPLDAIDMGESSPLKSNLTPRKQIEIEMDSFATRTPQDGDVVPQKDVLDILQKDPTLAVAMTGDAFNFFDSSPDTSAFLRDLVLKKSKVLSRLRPDDKAFVVEKIKQQGYTVGMCGDGANDCPALKVAHIGVSLSDAEASLAAPFTSKVLDISCVDILLREGRTALVTSFQCFKFMSMYALIQAFSTVILYSRSSAMTDGCFMYQDFFMIIPAAFTMSLTLPTKKLSKEEPAGSLLSFPILSGMLGQCIIQAAAQYIGVIIVEAQEWYVSPSDLLDQTIAAAAAEGVELTDEDLNNMSIPDYDITVLFLIGIIQYFATVMAFSIDKPFRQPFYKNIPFTISVSINLLVSVLIIVVPMPKLYDAFAMKDFPEERFKWIVFAIVVVNTFVTIAFEKFVVPFAFAMGRKVLERRKQKKENRYVAM